MIKILTLLFAFFYLVLATGINVSAHKCGKKIRLVSFHSAHEKKCPCGKKMRPGCCKDLHAYFKIADSQKATSKIVVTPPHFTKSVGAVLDKPEKSFETRMAFDITSYHAPPFKTKMPAYLTTGTLRI